MGEFFSILFAYKNSSARVVDDGGRNINDGGDRIIT